MKRVDFFNALCASKLRFLALILFWDLYFYLEPELGNSKKPVLFVDVSRSSDIVQ